MKRLSIFLAAAVMSGSAFADTYVQGYTKKDGTYVPGHYRSSPDQYRSNNRGSESMGGTQRDEYSGNGATNKRNSAYGLYDNDRDGLSNSFDAQPESKKNCNPYATYGGMVQKVTFLGNTDNVLLDDAPMNKPMSTRKNVTQF